ncbi:hypothetical protein ACFLQ2_03360 [archaeon]
MQSICIKCKGTRFLCGKPVCPRVEKARVLGKYKPVKKEISGESPSVFVGRYGYPRVQAGPMISPYGEASDSPEEWYGTPLTEIMEMRYRLVRTKEPLSVFATNPSRDLQEMQDISMSVRSVDTEAKFSRVSAMPSFDSSHAPFGQTGVLEKFRTTENAKIPRKVDAVVSDELKAADQIQKMYDKDVAVSQLSRIMSVGLLGIEKKMVPTRWSITATDDTIGKQMIEEIKDYRDLDEHLLFSNTYLGNHFEVLLVPGNWCFENVEAWMPGNIWLDSTADPEFAKDWEPYEGRKKYADSVTGAYYSARLGVLEYLKKIKRQAGAIVFREITPDYWTPVGVWQIRENVRAAMKEQPVKFQTLAEMLDEVGRRSTSRVWEKQSELLHRFRSREIMRKYLS